jgi:hypothetical protein
MSRISPKYLPQVGAPIDLIFEKLIENDCEYMNIQMNPNELQSSQPFTLSDDVHTAVNDDMHPIWIDNEMKIIDGHHKWVKALLDNTPIFVVKLSMDFKNAARLLNKIQDIYEYEQHQGMEEVEAQDAINMDNQADSGISDSEFLNTLEEDNLNAQSGDTSTNGQVIIGYRKDPIKENSVIGNFFMLKPVEGFDKYEIEFDNLLDVHSLGVVYKDGQNPIDILSKVWFPHVNFEKLSQQYNMPVENLKCKAIAEKAVKMGYDGIKYGDTLVQGLK